MRANPSIPYGFARLLKTFLETQSIKPARAATALTAGDRARAIAATELRNAIFVSGNPVQTNRMYRY